MNTHSQRYDLLILGASGFIGARTAQTALAAGWRVAGTYRTRPLPPGVPGWQVDVCDQAAVTGLLNETRPRAVIHCVASYTPHSLDYDSQMEASAYSTRALVAALRALGALTLDTRIVFVSTNAVFSGKLGRPCAETDLPDPDNRRDAYRYYGLARREGERITLDGWPNSLVARTASVDGRDAWGQLNPRLQALVDALRSGRSFTRYVDRVISPTLVDAVVSGLLEVASPGFPLPQSTGRVLHLAGRQSLTDFDYAHQIAAHLGIPHPPVEEDHYLPPGAVGPYNIALDVSRTQALLQTRLPDVAQVLACL
jgi:dTDP-4-dehydrorhamnose reductase